MLVSGGPNTVLTVEPLRWVHHSKVWNQDDCFTVKGTSSNMLFENIEAYKKTAK